MSTRPVDHRRAGPPHGDDRAQHPRAPVARAAARRPRFAAAPATTGSSTSRASSSSRSCRPTASTSSSSAACSTSAAARSPRCCASATRCARRSRRGAPRSSSSRTCREQWGSADPACCPREELGVMRPPGRRALRAAQPAPAEAGAELRGLGVSLHRALEVLERLREQADRVARPTSTLFWTRCGSRSTRRAGRTTAGRRCRTRWSACGPWHRSRCWPSSGSPWTTPPKRPSAASPALALSLRSPQRSAGRAAASAESEGGAPALWDYANSGHPRAAVA